MSARILHRLLGTLRHEPTRRRVRATLADDVVVDTTGALLVWEPRRVMYNIPEVQQRIRASHLPEKHAIRIAEGW